MDEQPQVRMTTSLVTGCAGFLGSHLCERLLARGDRVIGVDCFTHFNPRPVKEAHVEKLLAAPGFTLVEADIATFALDGLLEQVDNVFHLAAQPGVRTSFGGGIGAYIHNNVTATERLLQAAAGTELQAFVYASSSSVYGDQPTYPVTEDASLRPVSPYGATKVITEQLAGAYWQGQGVPVVGMRYFTVYGPRQRPDMAFAKFLRRAVLGKPLPIYGDGHQVREFTYCADVVQATIQAATHGERGSTYNIGGGQPVSVLNAIAIVSELMERPMTTEHLPLGPGEPRRTEGDISRAQRDLGFRPETPLVAGIAAHLAAVRTEFASRLHSEREVAV